jgi:hypothetical protein
MDRCEVELSNQIVEMLFPLVVNIRSNGYGTTQYHESKENNIDQGSKHILL